MNRQLPGPSIELCEGDKLEVEVTNFMHASETPITIHWHGQHQRGTSYMDGVPNLTQCYILPGDKFTYKFTPEPAGTFMYHSHVGAQLGDGFFGSLVIRQTQSKDPNSGLYDHDCDTPSRECEFTVILNDWVIGGTALDDYIISRYASRYYYMPKSTLINGHSSKVPVGNLYTKGKGNTPLEVFNVVAGKKYRFRLINLATVSCRYQVAIDYHKLKVIAADGYPVQPRGADIVTLFNGERYDVVVEATESENNYWFKAIPLGECNVGDDNANGIAILRYDGAPLVEPAGEQDKFLPTLLHPINVNKVFPVKTEKWRSGMIGAITAAELTSFNDMPDDLRGTPDYTFYVAMDRLENDPIYDYPQLYSNAVENPYVLGTSMFNNISFQFPHFPLLLNPSEAKYEKFCNKDTVNQQACFQERCHCTHMIGIPLGSIVEIFLIHESKKGKVSRGHPIHMHGYHAYLVGLSKVGGTSVETSEIRGMNEAGEIPKNLKNPTLRDTVQVTGGGYTVWRFKADNPGLWFFHCHVQTHMLEGQALILNVGDVGDFDKIPNGFPTNCLKPKKNISSGADALSLEMSILLLTLISASVMWYF